MLLHLWVEKIKTTITNLFMNSNLNLDNHSFQQVLNLVKPIEKTAIIEPELKVVTTALIRFEEKREHFVWVHPDEIMFVVSADHYVKALIKCGTQNKWMTRHCTIKELLAILPAGNFIRLNKFYLLNRNHFFGFNEKEKKLYLEDDFSVPVSHRISRFILDTIKK